MHRIAIVLALLSAGALAAPAAAGPSVTYKGQARSLKSDFRYGKVRVTVRDKKVTRILIESVTTTGCGGFMSVVFAPSDPDLQIVSGSARIRNGRLAVKYRPTKDVEDQTTEIRARITSRSATGTFESGDLCENAGRFTAKR